MKSRTSQKAENKGGPKSSDVDGATATDVTGSHSEDTSLDSKEVEGLGLSAISQSNMRDGETAGNKGFASAADISAKGDCKLSGIVLDAKVGKQLEKQAIGVSNTDYLRTTHLCRGFGCFNMLL